MSDKPWRIEVSSAARRDLRRLPDKVAAAIGEFITGPLSDSPARSSKPLHNDPVGYRSARRGDYRVLLRIDENAHTVLIGRVGHPAHLYRPH